LLRSEAIAISCIVATAAITFFFGMSTWTWGCKTEVINATDRITNFGLIGAVAMPVNNVRVVIKDFHIRVVTDEIMEAIFHHLCIHPPF